MTGAPHVTTGIVHMSGALRIALLTDDHVRGRMRRSDGGVAPCLRHLGGIVGAMGGI